MHYEIIHGSFKQNVNTSSKDPIIQEHPLFKAKKQEIVEVPEVKKEQDDATSNVPSEVPLSTQS